MKKFKAFTAVFISFLSVLIIFNGCFGAKDPDSSKVTKKVDEPSPDKQNMEGVDPLDNVAETQKLREEALEKEKNARKNKTVDTNNSNVIYLQSPADAFVMNNENNQNQNDSETIELIKSKIKSIYFEFDKFSIREDMLGTINQNVKLVNSESAIKYSVVVEGNCDEWGTDEYNYALGLKRAQIIKEALISEGVAENRISVLSYGEANPVCLEYKAECWAKNRRTDFLLYQ
jgi:peptidoglycan-associated lipoprotein